MCLIFDAILSDMPKKRSPSGTKTKKTAAKKLPVKLRSPPMTKMDKIKIDSVTIKFVESI